MNLTPRRKVATIVSIASVAALALVAGTAAATASILHATPTSASMPTGMADAAPAVDTTGFPTGGPGIFTDTCKLTKTAADDPIMMPGMTGQSMQHDFFGNPDVTASSKTSDLVGGSSTCTTSADASAYWTPVLYQNGKALHPKSTLIYWRAPAQTASSVTTIPAGLTMIAGNETATAPQSTKVAAWTCTSNPGKAFDTPQNCASGKLRLVMFFPNCWDGTTLDGMSQKNVVYATSAKGACPASHPVQIPQIVMHMVYPTSTAADLTLSIGPTQTGPTVTTHADFMNGWNEKILTADVAACTTAGVRCGPVTGADATPKGGKTPAERKTKRDKSTSQG